MGAPSEWIAARGLWPASADPSELVIADHVLNDVDLSLAAKDCSRYSSRLKGNPSTRLTTRSKTQPTSPRRLMSFSGPDWLSASRDDRGGARGVCESLAPRIYSVAVMYILSASSNALRIASRAFDRSPLLRLGWPSQQPSGNTLSAWLFCST